MLSIQAVIVLVVNIAAKHQQRQGSSKHVFHLVQHGQFYSVNNDGPLSRLGRWQTSRLADHLSYLLDNRTLDTVQTSTYFRSLDTQNLVMFRLEPSIIALINVSHDSAWNQVNDSDVQFHLEKLKELAIKYASRERRGSYHMIITHSDVIAYLICLVAVRASRLIEQCGADLSTFSSSHASLTTLVIFVDNRYKTNTRIRHSSLFFTPHLDQPPDSSRKPEPTIHLFNELCTQVQYPTAVRIWRRMGCGETFYKWFIGELAQSKCGWTFAIVLQQNDSDILSSLHNYFSDFFELTSSSKSLKTIRLMRMRFVLRQHMEFNRQAFYSIPQNPIQ